VFPSRDIPPNISEEDNHIVGIVVINLNFPQTPAREVAVTHSVFAGIVVISVEDLGLEIYGGQVVPAVGIAGQ
jgi:hypothetical protein